MLNSFNLTVMNTENKGDFWNGFVQGMIMNPVTMLLLSTGVLVAGDTETKR